MRIQFDQNQPFQRDAISAVLDIFDGQPLAQGRFEVSFQASSELYSELGYGNGLSLSPSALLENVRKVQERNAIPPSESLDDLHFSVEMETGTGKTYVYLRTIYELHLRYGWSKFTIVVPSVAIREGVLTSLKLLREHFAALYDNTPADTWVYDSKQIARLRSFATSNTLQILVINIQAFDKVSNAVIHQENDRLGGRKPIEFIQAARPIVIMDEPQNMESDIAKNAIASLNPLCTLRYSATHKNRYNLLYRLGPVQAYKLGLVKHIEATCVIEGNDFNKPHISVESITSAKNTITAKLTIDVQGAKGVTRKAVSVRGKQENLRELSGDREIYEGYIVDRIHYGDGYVEFTNGVRLEKGQTQGVDSDLVMQKQIEETIRHHFENELKMLSRAEGERAKVLSLFFIDRVANYAEEEGKIRRWFVAAYQKIANSPLYRDIALPVEQVHNGYFAQTKGVYKESTEGRDTEADNEAYELIMRDKERLMDRGEPLRFIFSHSALREGWDNPNVFQICTLLETKSIIRKRQQIGRGLRLPVDESGKRIFDPRIARLTVIANESFGDFAKQLQNEIREESGDRESVPIANSRKRIKANLSPDWRENEAFVELWKRIKTRTRYAVHYDTVSLVIKSAEYLHKSPEIAPPQILVTTHRIESLDGGNLSATLSSAHRETATPYDFLLPDIIGYLQRETLLSRAALTQLLARSGRLKDFTVNPQQFLDQATRAIQYAKQELMVDGVTYEPLTGIEEAWDMMRFETEIPESYADRLIPVNNSLYDVIECDSMVERKFSEVLNRRGDIKFFLKLPRWFCIETPLGRYFPDWAIVKQSIGEQERLYLVRETKSTTEQFAIRPTEEAKITCGKRHFESLRPKVDFQKVTDADQV